MALRQITRTLRVVNITHATSQFASFSTMPLESNLNIDKTITSQQV